MKEFNISTSGVVIIILIIILMPIGSSWITSAYYKRANERNVTAFTSKIKTYKTKYDQEVSSKQAIIVENKRYKFLNDSLRVITKNFKKPEVVTRIRTVFRVDTVRVGYERPIPIQFKRQFSVGDKYYKIAGLSTNTGLAFDTIRVYNQQDIVFGEKKRGVITADIVNDNPYIEVKNVQIYTYRPKKKLHEKWYIAGPIGFVAGLLFSK
jgi:hypothetical protein